MNIVIQKAKMENGKEVVIIANHTDFHAHHRQLPDVEWQPLSTEVLIRSYPNYQFLSGKVF